MHFRFALRKKTVGLILCGIFLALTVAILSAGITWYTVDRAGLLRTACEAGMPNYTRPASVDPDELGCVILAQEKRYTGVFSTGFEVSNFASEDFIALPGETDGEQGLRSWFHCPSTGCGDALTAQLAQNSLGNCETEGHGSGLANITVDGWVSIGGGPYGHLGSYPREFYADRIVSVSPPGKEVISRIRFGRKLMGVCKGGPGLRAIWRFLGNPG